jgi:hypothetical protein
MSEASYMMLKAAEGGDTDKVINYITVKHVDKRTRNNYGVRWVDSYHQYLLLAPVINLCSLLYVSYSNNSAIIFAANNGHLELLKALVDIGDDIEDRSNNGRTPLHWASLWGHYPVVEYLVDIGANISSTDVTGMTPLMCAVYNNQKEIVSYLVQQGANPTVKNNYEGTCMSIAKVQRNQAMIDFLQPYFPPESAIDSSPYILAIQIIYREVKIFFRVLQDELTILHHDFWIYMDIMMEYMSAYNDENMMKMAHHFYNTTALQIDSLIRQVSFNMRSLTQYSRQCANDACTFYESLSVISDAWKTVVERYHTLMFQVYHHSRAFLEQAAEEWTVYWESVPEDNMMKSTVKMVIEYLIKVFSKSFNYGASVGSNECPIHDPLCRKRNNSTNRKIVHNNHVNDL